LERDINKELNEMSTWEYSEDWSPGDVSDKELERIEMLLGENVEEKSGDNPLILGPNETIGEDRLERSIIYLLKLNEKKILDLIEKEAGKNTLKEIKSVEEVAKKIDTLVSFDGLKTISDKVIKDNFMKGWDSAEKQLFRNLVLNNSAMDFIKDYTFGNIKDMTKDIAKNLRQELQRGIMEGEGATKIKERVKSVFNVGENRASMIARTETNRAQNQGHLQGFKASGEDYQKQWVTHEDDRTSPICKRLDNQIVGMDENFEDKTSGWSGPCPPAHVNCRSSIIFIEKE